MTDEELIGEIEKQRSLMISVATGGRRIQAVNEEYLDRRSRVAAQLGRRGISDPNPHSDLWQWYGAWSAGNMPTYQSRRTYISELYEPLIARLRGVSSGRRANIFERPTGWPRVDRVIDEIRLSLQQAENEEQFQAIGLLCREVLISVGQVVYDQRKHSSEDGVTPSDTDAKRMLHSYLSTELSGNQNEGVRRHAKASLSLANDLQHHRTADYRQAALCSEATASVVNIVSIVSGRRDPDGRQVGLMQSMTEVQGLGQHHIAVLVAIAQEIEGPNDAVSVHSIRSVTASAGFTKIATNLGLKALLDKELIFTREEQGYNDYHNTYICYGVTDRGMAWLAENPDVITFLAKPERTEKGSRVEDDVPF